MCLLDLRMECLPMDKRQLKALEKKLAARCQELQAAVQRNICDGRASDERAAEHWGHCQDQYRKRDGIRAECQCFPAPSALARSSQAHRRRHVQILHAVRRRNQSSTVGSRSLDSLLHWLPRAVGAFTLGFAPNFAPSLPRPLPNWR